MKKLNWIYLMLFSTWMGFSQNAPVTFETGEYGSSWDWTVFENSTNPPLEIIANPDPTGLNTSATVAKFTALQTGQPWAGCESLHGATNLGPFVLDATNSTIKIMVWKPIISDVGIKLVANSGWAQAEIKVANTLINQWEELSFDFSSYMNPPSAEGAYDQIVVFPDFNLAGRAQDNIVYFDNISFSASTGGPTAPMVAAPTPTEDPANVISLFSDAYTNVPVDTWQTPWSAAVLEDITIEGNPTKKYNALDFVGIETVANQLDITGMTYFHLDVWSADFSFFGVKLVDFGPDGAFGGGDDTEHQVNFNGLAQGEWVSLDIPLSSFTGLTGLENIAQLILVGQPTGATTIYIDNVYFYTAAATEPMVAAPTPTEDPANVISLFSDAYTNVSVDTWQTPWSAAVLEDITIEGNPTKKYNALDFVGIETVANQLDITGMTYFHLDVWSADFSFFGVKLVDFGPDGAFGGGDDTEHQVNFNGLAQGEWVSLDIPLSSFTGLTGLENIAQLILVGQPTGATTIYIDNVYFYTAAATEPMVAAPTPTEDPANVISLFSDAYSNVPVDTWQTPWSAAVLEDITIEGNPTKKYNALDFVGIETVANQLDITGMTYFHLDVWSADFSFFGVKLVDFGPDGAFGGGDDTEHQVNFNGLAQGEWVSLDIPLSSFTGLTGLENIAQLILVGQPTGATTIYIDNVYFYTDAVLVSCNDGIMNGDETGIDCGGENCPACPTVCLAEIGTITPPAQTTVAFGGTVAAPTVVGQQTDAEFVYVFVITTDIPGNATTFDVVGATLDGSVNFANAQLVSNMVLPAGTYNVHALSFQGTLAELLALNITSGEQALEAINSGAVCADLAVPGYQIIQLDQVIELDCPALNANIGDLCDDDNNNTSDDMVNSNCVCVGTQVGPVYDCPAINANIGDLCDDENSNTSDDMVNSNCVCVGTPVGPVYDCPAINANIGDLCDDDNNNTSDDMVNSNCVCVGTPVGPIYDCPALMANVNDACNDNNSYTSNDAVNTNCVCVGTYSALAFTNLNTTLGANDTYTVSFNVTGGNGVYSSAGGAFTGSAFTSSAISCGNGYSFTITDGSNQTPLVVSGLAACSIDLCDSFMAQEIGYSCNPTVGSSTFSYMIMGGTAPYSIFGDYSDIGLPAGASFSVEVLDGSNLTLTVMDADGCSYSISEENVQCVKCSYEIYMNDDEAIICGNDSFTATYTFTDGNDEFPENGEIGFAVHTSSGSSAGTVLVTNSTGTFNFASIPGAIYGSTYYVSAIVGPDNDGDGFPDLDDSCTKVAQGTAIEFIAPIVINTGEISCDEASGVTTVNFTITGGMPPYFVTGDVNAVYQSGQMFSVSYIDGTFWTLSATDASGCPATSIIGPPLTCSKTAITLISFTGSARDNGNILNWITASEYENDFFTLSKSKDGVNFETIATIEGKGTTTSQNSYSFIDEAASCEQVYYRLSQTDFDGTTTVMPNLVAIRNTDFCQTVSISPIPATSTLNVAYYTTNGGQVAIKVFDVLGKEISNDTREVEMGTSQLSMDISTMVNGVYFLHITQNGNSIIQKFIKE